MIQMHMQQGLSQDARIIRQEVFVEEQGFHHGKGAERMGLAYWIPFFIVVLGNIGYPAAIRRPFITDQIGICRETANHALLYFFPR